MDEPLRTRYVDRSFKGKENEYYDLLKESTTLYVGNLSFKTTEDQLYALFSRAGMIKNIVMGLNRNTNLPCGFCFVEYVSVSDTLKALHYISGTMLSDRIIRCDIDIGFSEGRQYGRGHSGGQVRMNSELITMKTEADMEEWVQLLADLVNRHVY